MGSVGTGVKETKRQSHKSFSMVSNYAYSTNINGLGPLIKYCPLQKKDEKKLGHFSATTLI